MKKIWIICLALIWLLPQAAFAHSKLVETLPEKDSTSEVSPQEIRLSFNTKIEKISNFKLFDAKGNEIALGDTVVEGDTMSNRPAAPLSGGDYTVKWTIVGADGHAIEGQYGFSIASTVTTATPDPTAPPATDTEDTTKEPSVTPDPDGSDDNGATSSPSPSPSVSPSTSPDNSDEDNNGSESGWSPLIAIGGIIVVAAVAAVLIRRRKP